MIAGIIVAIYFEVLIRWVGGAEGATLVDHLIMSIPPVFCLSVGAVYQWHAARGRYDFEMLPAWFCKLLCLIPVFFVVGNLVLFTWLFLLGGIEQL